MRSEQSRDFKPCVGKFSVGLHQVHPGVVDFLLLARTSNRVGRRCAGKSVAR